MVGDKVVGRDYSGNPISGIVVNVTPGATSCNLSIVPLANLVSCQNCSSFLHVDDALPLPVPVKS